MTVRLNKLLATRGIGARRKCDTLIQSGAVRVNGAVVTEPGRQVEPGRDRVEVQGRALPPAVAHHTFMLHKPVGVISTLSDPEGRRSIADFLPAGQRLFPVGRLDADTSGLLLLTNDGELAHHLMHPRYGVAKRYRIHVDREPSSGALERLRRGVEFEPGVVSAPAEVWLRGTSDGEAVIEMALHEGRHRQVRRMCEAVRLEVHRLHRWGYGPLRLGELARGMWRELSDEEVASLHAASARPRARAAASGATGARSFDRVRPRRTAGPPRRATPGPRSEERGRSTRPADGPGGGSRGERAARDRRSAGPRRRERSERRSPGAERSAGEAFRRGRPAPAGRAARPGFGAFPPRAAGRGAGRRSRPMNPPRSERPRRGR